MILYLLSLLTHDNRGELNPGAGGGEGKEGGEGGGGSGNDQPWYSSLPDELVVEHEGKQVPLRDHPFIKETPDIPTLAKRAYDNHRAVGGSIKLPGKDAKPEEVKMLKDKLYQAGVFQAPPDSPDKYDFKKWQEAAGPLADEELTKGYREWAHKWGIPQEALNEAVDLRINELNGAKGVIEYDRAESEKQLELKAQQEGLTVKEVYAAGGAWLAKHVSEQGMAKLKASGLANDPELAWMIAKAGRDSGEDISIVEGSEGGADIEEAYQEAKRIMTDRNHPDHDAFVKEGESGPLHDKVSMAYRRKFPGEYSGVGGSE